MKIYIYDPCAREKGLEEAQINSNKTIRFDSGNDEYRIKFLDNGYLEIMKYSNSRKTGGTDTIQVMPYSCNVIRIT